MDLLALVAVAFAGSWFAAPLGRSAGVAMLGRIAQGFVIGAMLAGFVASVFEKRGVTAYAWPLLAAVLLAALAAVVREARRVPVRAERRGAAWLGWSALVGVVLAHTLLALFEVRERPPYPWDAWTNWLFRARAWYLEPGVSFAWQPDAQSGPFALQVPGAHYPASVPGLVAWLARLHGEWSYPRLLLAWPLAYAATTLAFGALADQVLRSRAIAAGAATVFAATPLLVTHAMLAGYADLWLTGLVVVASGAAYEWRRSGWAGPALAVAMLAPVLVKVEGTIWAGLLFASIAFAARPRTAAAAVLALVVALAACLLVPGGLHAFGDRLVISADLVRIPYLGETPLLVNPVFGPMMRAALLSETFGIAVWGLLAAAIAAPLTRRARAGQPVAHAEREAIRMLGIYGGLVLAFQLALFAFTLAGRWALDQTSLSRLLMQMLPVWLVLAARVFEHLDPAASRRGAQLGP